MSSLGKWFETYHLESGIHGDMNIDNNGDFQVLTAVPQPSKKEKTPFNIDSWLQSEYFLYEIDKVSFSIEQNDFFRGIINKVSIENLRYIRDRQGALRTRAFDEHAETSLFSIQNIVFLTSNYAEGHIDGIGLIYEQYRNSYKFFIRNISYEVSQEEVLPEISPKRRRARAPLSSGQRREIKELNTCTSIHIPDLAKDNHLKKRLSYLNSRDRCGILLKINMIPETNRIGDVVMTVEKVKFSISSNDVFSMFHIFSVLSSNFIEERHYMRSKLRNEVFKTEQYDEILKIIKHNEQLLENQRRKVSTLNASDDSKDEENMMNEPTFGNKDSIKFSMKIDGIGISFAKGKEVIIGC